MTGAALAVTVTARASLAVLPGGTVIGTLTGEPEALVTVTTPLVSVACTDPAVWAAAQADCWPRTWASVTSVIWTSGAAVLVQASYWVSMLLSSVNRVYPFAALLPPIRLVWCA